MFHQLVLCIGWTDEQPQDAEQFSIFHFEHGLD
jgi:hypothetical protein